MGSMLKKGKRLLKKQQIKENKVILKTMGELIDEMNRVTNVLVQDPELTEDNFDEKLKAASDFGFTEKQVKMIKDKAVYQL